MGSTAQLATLDHKISKDRRAIVTKYNPQIAQLVPHATAIEHNGSYFHLVPHDHEATKLLNNLGYSVGSPILHHYDWCNTTPFESQKVTAALMVDNKRAYILNDMGTGKTRASLYATDYLIKTGEIKKVLVVAPISTMTQVWEKEIFECFPHRRSIVLHHTSKQKRLAFLEEDADYYIINHDGLKLLEKELINRSDIDAVIIDELAILRNARTARWKAANRILQTKPWAWGMTGSPTPKEPTDAYGQIRLLTPQRVPKFFKAFQAETMVQLTQFKWIPRKDANDTVHRLMQPAVRYSREDCIDLPPTTYSTREVALSSEQEDAYAEMKREFTTQFKGVEITAANAGVMASKLIQIGAGFAYADGVPITLDCSARVNALKDILDSTPHKVIVFSPFKYSVDTLATLLMKDYSVEKIHGDVSKKERDRIFSAFQGSSEPRVLVAHPQVMAHGLTLTSANTIVWYSPLWDLEIYEQANARITRPSQKNNTHIIHLQASGIEKRVYSLLKSRGNMMRGLLSLFRGQ